jgi:predicted enzyme related to lactoylglutathione lyase
VERRRIIHHEDKGDGHLHFFTTDLDGSIGFYEALRFTLTRRHRHDSQEAAQLEAGELTVDLNRAGAANNPKYSHFAVQVDDLDEDAGTLRAKGYDVEGPSFNQNTGRWILTARDPNGFLIQMVHTEQRS